MTSSFPFPRKLLILASVLPLAVLIGYMLATPDTLNSLALVALVFGVLVLPLLIYFHHPILIFSCNFAFSIYLLPGNPTLCMLMTLVSFSLSVLGFVMDKETKLLHEPSVTWALIFLAAVVLFTAKMTGGMGVRTFGGSTYGGKSYFLILFGILAYFAVSFQPIPLEKAQKYCALYFLPGTSTALSNLIFLVPMLWPLYGFFPVDYAMSQAMEEFSTTMTSPGLNRLAGVGFSAAWVFHYMVLRYGIRGLLDFTKPWRFVIALTILYISLLGGFRSVFVVYALVLAIQFCLEGLVRTRLFPAAILASVLGFAALIPLASKLPLSVQRSLSVLPLNIDPVARLDAQGSSDWRLNMWKVLVQEIPDYFWLGKGYTANAADYALAVESTRRGLAPSFETALVAGNYHNGPLSVIVPFGIWGVLAFFAFLIAAGRVFYLNYRYGNPALRLINTFLFSFFLARLVYFLGVFGGITSDTAFFGTLTGLSISLNGGVCRARPAEEPSGEVETGESVAMGVRRIRSERA